MKKFMPFMMLSLTVFIVQNIHAQNWLLAGNTTTPTSKLGTLNSLPLIVITKSGERLRVDTFGRVGIGTSVPASSALLDITSSSRGFLVPRMTTAQRTAIPSPVLGLLVFQTDGTKGFYYYDGGWKAVTPSIPASANKALSNLTAPTAVNVDLLPGLNNTRNLGSKTKRWKNIYFSGDIYKDTFRFISTQGLANLFVGLSSGISVTSGYNDLGVGHQALKQNTTGYFNTALGIQAMQNNTTGSRNTANGYAALYNNIAGFNNTALGHDALFYNVSGFGNTAIGQFTLVYNSGSGNTAVGDSSLAYNTVGFGKHSKWILQPGK